MMFSFQAAYAAVYKADYIASILANFQAAYAAVYI